MKSKLVERILLNDSLDSLIADVTEIKSRGIELTMDGFIALLENFKIEINED